MGGGNEKYLHIALQARVAEGVQNPQMDAYSELIQLERHPLLQILECVLAEHSRKQVVHGFFFPSPSSWVKLSRGGGGDGGTGVGGDERPEMLVRHVISYAVHGELCEHTYL